MGSCVSTCTLSTNTSCCSTDLCNAYKIETQTFNSGFNNAQNSQNYILTLFGLFLILYY